MKCFHRLTQSPSEGSDHREADDAEQRRKDGLRPDTAGDLGGPVPVACEDLVGGHNLAGLSVHGGDVEDVEKRKKYADVKDDADGSLTSASSDEGRESILCSKDGPFLVDACLMCSVTHAEDATLSGAEWMVCGASRAPGPACGACWVAQSVFCTSGMPALINYRTTYLPAHVCFAAAPFARRDHHARERRISHSHCSPESTTLLT